MILKELLGTKWPEGTRVRRKDWPKEWWFKPKFVDKYGRYFGITQDGHGTSWAIRDDWETVGNY